LQAGAWKSKGNKKETGKKKKPLCLGEEDGKRILLSVEKL